MTTRHFYLGLAVLGLLIPNSAFWPWVVAHGLDPQRFVQDLFANHSSYFDGASLAHITGIVTGHDPEAVDGRRPGSYQTLDQLLVGSTAASGGEWLWKRGEDAVDGVVETVRDLAEGLVRIR